MFTDGADGMDAEAQARVARELWQNLDVIDRYASENPNGLSAGELAVIRQWRDGLTGYFIVNRFRDGVVRFMHGGYSFEVSGISVEVEDMVGDLPATVYTTLLPFDGLIVFAEYLGLMPVKFGDTFATSLDAEMDAAIESGLCVSSAEGLLAVAPAIRKEAIQRDLDALAEDLEEESRQSEPVAGQHRGVLAGLSDEERERVIREEFGRESEMPDSSPFQWLKAQCTEGTVTRSFAELVERQSEDFLAELKDSFLDIATAEYSVALHDKVIESYLETIEAGAETPDTKKLIAENESLAQAFREKLAEQGTDDIMLEFFTNRDKLEELIAKRVPQQIAALRDLVVRGGYLSVREDSLDSPAGLPFPVFGINFAFYDGETFEFVVPDEVIGTLREIDWDDVIDRNERRRQLAMFFDAIVELRGIVPLDDALVEYMNFHPNSFGEDDALDTLFDAMNREECAAQSLVAGSDEYLLHYELAWEWRRDRGLDMYGGDGYNEGPLTTMLENLMALQAGKDPRPVEPEMLEGEYGLFSWKEKQPAVRAMRDFLDEHVPDDRNDCYFADKVIEELLEEAKWGLQNESVNTFFRILEHNDFIPEEHQVQPLLSMWMNIGNSLPVWTNNGWSPNDLLAKDLGHPVFFNEDGSIKKVGRNDPCPCGSGKKYKKCCGR